MLVAECPRHGAGCGGRTVFVYVHTYVYTLGWGMSSNIIQNLKNIPW